MLTEVIISRMGNPEPEKGPVSPLEWEMGIPKTSHYCEFEICVIPRRLHVALTPPLLICIAMK